jgi:hypothetical protein
MLELYLTIAFSILNILVPYGIVRYDRGRLRADQLARAWNRPSFACAIYFFGPLSLPAHFWVTRRRPAALGFGVLLCIAVLGAEWALGSVLEFLLA